MNAQELETASRLGAPFVNVVWEDRQFGSIAWKQRRRFGDHFGTDFTNPDFVRFAESFGLSAWRVTAADEFDDLFRHTLELSEPSLIVLEIGLRDRCGDRRRTRGGDGSHLNRRTSALDRNHALSTRRRSVLVVEAT
jgi:thiamine pyrophosphate-dependent acetolactate synthase large subunit-like protein